MSSDDHHQGGGSAGAAFDSSAEASSGSGSGCRWTVVRHAESAANAHTRSWPVLLTCRCCIDPGIVDPPLSEAGAAAARELGEQLLRLDYMSTQHVDVIIVSPLRRALQTALFLFGSQPNVKFLVTPLHREISDTSGDVGTDPSQLVSEFPQFNFDALLKADADSAAPSAWWATDGIAEAHEESHESVAERCRAFTRFLSASADLRAARHIVIVGHSQFFRVWTRQSKMANLEFRTFDPAHFR